MLAGAGSSPVDLAAGRVQYLPTEEQMAFSLSDLVHLQLTCFLLFLGTVSAATLGGWN